MRQNPSSCPSPHYSTKTSFPPQVRRPLLRSPPWHSFLLMLFWELNPPLSLYCRLSLLSWLIWERLWLALYLSLVRISHSGHPVEALASQWGGLSLSTDIKDRSCVFSLPRHYRSGSGNGNTNLLFICNPKLIPNWLIGRYRTCQTVEVLLRCQ